MSVCSPCLTACAVPLCTAEIILGTISSLSTDVIIIIENKGTGRKQYVSTQSDGAGIVTLVTSGLGLMANQTYEISVVLKTATVLCDKETLTIGTSTTSCVMVLFENILDTNGCQVAFESQTLTVPENVQPGTNCLCVTQAMLDAIKPYKSYSALLYQQPQFDGLLIVGVEYTILLYVGGDDFTNVGALANVQGEVFVATGTTPASWAGFSILTNNLAPQVTVLENSIGNIVWSRVTTGTYAAILANAFPQLKTWFSITKNENNNQAVQWGDINTLSIITSYTAVQVAAPNEPVQYIGKDGLLLYTPIEIRVYN